MKNRHHYSLLLAAAILCAAGIAGAAQPELRMPHQQMKPGIQINPGVIAKLSPCPRGWKLAWGSSGGAFMCEPKPVRQFECPHDTHFVRQGSCAVGCQQTVY